MFGRFKPDPTQKLQKQYLIKLEQAMHAQRNGDIRLHGELTAQAEEIRAEMKLIEKLRRGVEEP